MLYFLVQGNSCLTFHILACAEVYKLCLGGELYAVSLSGTLDVATEAAVGQLGKSSTLLAP